MSPSHAHDFRIYGRNSTDNSSQATRVYTTEAATDWVLVYEHKSDIDGEANYFKNTDTTGHATIKTTVVDNNSDPLDEFDDRGIKYTVFETGNPLNDNL